MRLLLTGRCMTRASNRGAAAGSVATSLIRGKSSRSGKYQLGPARMSRLTNDPVIARPAPECPWRQIETIDIAARSKLMRAPIIPTPRTLVATGVDMVANRCNSTPISSNWAENMANRLLHAARLDCFCRSRAAICYGSTPFELTFSKPERPRIPSSVTRRHLDDHRRAMVLAKSSLFKRGLSPCRP